MEPRARAGKNVGKETFNRKEVSSLLYAYGDVEDPLPDTMRVLDEIVTEFLDGICFEASRHAQVAGRQKLKFDDFEFALRRNPQYLGRVRSMIEKRQEIKEARQGFNEDETAVAKDAAKDAAAPTTSGTARDDALDDLDEDEDLEYLNSAVPTKGTSSKKRKKAPK
ncbi:TFIID-18kDa-domain-containing protein [Hypoxylon rubiginosum]|uniref:TFIID-18kDa-domain-containing protein n=1 Tax=Hypoxylon rubiginosum TaxID=110542 RepID=A0ACC0CYB3_9PEZI|nr:TFIID-18kDa-domain-containing protein [Hypoxylon rubiginosum]